MPALRGSSATPGGRIRSAIEGLPTAIPLGTALVLAILLAPRPALAAHSYDLCVPPFTFADRWDDVTPIAGYAGDVSGNLDWRNNGTWDAESFTDVNGNGVRDINEPYADGNGNGRYDQEFYDPLRTGYVISPVPGNDLAPEGDLGREFLLVPAKSPVDQAPGHYFFQAAGCDFLGLPTLIERPTGADARAFDEWLTARIALDPDATLDPATWRVVTASPCDERLIQLPLYDPRVQLGHGRSQLSLAKVMHVFLESPAGRGSAYVRIALPPAPAYTPLAECASAPPQAIFPGATAAPRASPSPTGVQTTAPTWGALKATYR